MHGYKSTFDRALLIWQWEPKKVHYNYRKKMIKAIIGLGNSGKEYEKTYHNAGAFVASELVKRLAAEGKELRLYPISGFMNVSGVPIAAWIKKNNLSVEEILVVHDDSDLPIGGYKVTKGGGSAGHKGIESISDHLHTTDFWRLRVGIRDPQEQIRKKAGEFVLDRWSGAEEQKLLEVCVAAQTAVLPLISEASS